MLGVCVVTCNQPTGKFTIKVDCIESIEFQKLWSLRFDFGYKPKGQQGVTYVKNCQNETGKFLLKIILFVNILWKKPVSNWNSFKFLCLISVKFNRKKTFSLFIFEKLKDSLLKISA